MILRFALTALLLAAPACSFAQVSLAPVEYNIDLAPLVEGLAPLVAALLAALAAWLARKIATFLNLRSDAIARSFLDGLFQRALALALARLHGQPLTVETKSQVIASAASYAAKYGPDTLRRFGLHDEKLREVLQARLELELPPRAPVGERE